MALLKTGRQIGQTIKSAGRLRTIVGVFASHGFQNVAEKAKLGRFLLKKFYSSEDINKYSTAERLRMCFEQLGPTFVKLGQLLATRPDLIPAEIADEFKKLHDRVSPVDFDDIRSLVEEQFGAIENVFSEFDESPLASASIAQVHSARLKNGTQVVVKIQRPGIVDVINDDLIVLYNLASLLEKYVPESRVFNPTTIVDEFFKTLELETNFLIEANNIKRFERNFEDDITLFIPRVFLEYSGPQVLVLETLHGTPLSQLTSKDAATMDAAQVVRVGLRAFFKMVFIHRFFHGDLHAGNIFLLPENKIGLVDFGVVGRLSEKTRDAIADLLIALAQEDYETFAETFLDLAPYNENINHERFGRDLRDLISPHFGLSFKNVNLGKLLMDSTSLAARHHVSIPSDLMLFFKAVVTVEGMGRLIVEDFDLLEYASEFASDIVKAKYEPERILRDTTHFAREVSSLMSGLPRQARQLLRKWNSPTYALKLHIEEFQDFRAIIEKSSRKISNAIIIASLIVGGSIALQFQGQPLLIGLPVVSVLSFLAALLLLIFR